MMDDTEFNALVSKVCSEFKGSSNDLVDAVGLVVVGRLYGWRVMRLISTRKAWADSNALFGDLKGAEIIPERGVLAYKSVGLAIADKVGKYWDFIRNNRVDELPFKDRKGII